MRKTQEKMKKAKEIELFSDLSSSSSSLEEFMKKKALKNRKKEEIIEKTQKIKEKRVVTDSDSSNEKQLSFVDLTYEQFDEIKQKKKHCENSPSIIMKTEDLEKKIKELQRDLPFDEKKPDDFKLKKSDFNTKKIDFSLKKADFDFGLKKTGFIMRKEEKEEESSSDEFSQEKIFEKYSEIKKKKNYSFCKENEFEQLQLMKYFFSLIF